MKSAYLILPLAFLLGACSLYGQRLKDKRTKITYVSLPEKKLPESYTTYSVGVYGWAVTAGGSNPDAAAKKINMDGFKRIAYSREGGGHLRIMVNTGTVTQGQAELKSKKNVYKNDKTKKETVTWEYWYEVPYSGGTSYQIYDPEGNILDSGGSSLGDTKSTRTYNNSSELGKNYSNLMNDLKKKYSNEVSNNIIGQVNQSLAKNFDFRKTIADPELFLIVNYDTEAEYDKYYEQIDKEWKNLDAATKTEDLKAKFGDALAFYEKEAEMDTKGEKKLERVFEASNYNAALLNFYLDDFEKAVRYANRVIAQEGKHKKASEIIEKAQAIKVLMDLHGIPTMHYSRDLTNAMGPAASKALEIAQEAMENANDMLTGTIAINDEIISGTFVSEKGTGELDFSQKGNTKFAAKKEDGTTVEYDLMAKEITAFSIGDRSFVKRTFTPCAKGKSNPAIHVMEEIYNSERIVLYKYYPSGGALSDAKTEFAFKKAAEENPVSLHDTQFLILKKGLANYFSDCADLKAMCEEGGIENEQESLIKAARIYSEVCQ
ncbi:MAG: RHS repeat protein [Bacteroidetes bacterium]|nr:RHS repeat protein [Bacteroidota bacterium]